MMEYLSCHHVSDALIYYTEIVTMHFPQCNIKILTYHEMYYFPKFLFLNNLFFAFMTLNRSQMFSNLILDP